MIKQPSGPLRLGDVEIFMQVMTASGPIAGCYRFSAEAMKSAVCAEQMVAEAALMLFKQSERPAQEQSKDT